MSEIKNPEAMVQDQNFDPTPKNSVENTEKTIEEMENTEIIPDVQTLGAATGSTPPSKEDVKNEEPTVNEQVPVESPAEDTAKVEPDTPESTAPAEDGTIEPKAVVKLNKLHIYSTSGLEAMGVRLARIVDNRDLDEKAIKKKIVSIKKAKGVISPTQLVSARKCLEQGHEVKLLDGTKVDWETKDLDNIYVIVDGQHRDEAIRRIAKDPKEKEKYENYYYVPLIEDFVVNDLLRETNTATFPWKDRQYINNLIMMKGDVDINLDLLKEVQAHPKASTKAAIHWLTLDTSKTLYSRQIIAAMIDDNELKKIVDVDGKTFNAGKELFNAAEEALGDLAGTTSYSDWTLNQFKKNPGVSSLDMAAKMTKFFNWLKDNGATKYKSLKGSRATKDTEYVAKETVIHQELTKDYTLFVDSLGE